MVTDDLDRKSMGSLVHLPQSKRGLVKELSGLQSNGVSFGVGEKGGLFAHLKFVP